jgi:hypothetical protein
MLKLEKAGNGFYCPDDPGEPGLGEKRWSVDLGEARIVSELFKHLEVLEIGTGLGVATKIISEKAYWVHTVDVDQWVKDNVSPNLPRNTTFYMDIDKVPMMIEGAFIDGLHTYEQCMIDIDNARFHVKKGGLIVFHDANMPEIHKAVVDSGLVCYYIKTPAGMVFGWNE